MSSTIAGWFVGDVDTAGRCTPLALFRCVHSLGDGQIDWQAERKSLSQWVPQGLHIIGLHAYCTSVDELAALLETYATALRDVIAPEALSFAVFAVGPELGKGDFFRAALPATGGRAELQPIEGPAVLEDVRANLHETHIILRARPVVTLQIRHCGDSSWAEAFGHARRAALEQLQSARACFAFPDARHVGVVSLGHEPESTAAPLAAGPCGALDNTSSLGSVAAEEEGEEDDEGDEEEAVDGRVGKRSGSKKAKKGGKKGGGGKKGHRPAKPSAADVPLAEPAAASGLPAGCPYAVTVLWPQSPTGDGASKGSKQTAPLLSIAPWQQGAQFTSVPLQLDAIVYARRESALYSALTLLKATLVTQLEQLSSRHLDAAPSADSTAQLTARAYVFQPAGQPLLHSMLYCLPKRADATEPTLRQQRLEAHRRLGLPINRPLLRTCNALGEDAHAAGASGTPIPGLLRDTHLGLPPSGLKNGRVSLVQGSYEYFHYMQWTGNGQHTKPYDDCGWGCAYRSLMSILSWFRLQGYASVPNPTHREIQELLVFHCGQDAATLLGKQMWLGSQDIAYYLDYAIGVTCKTEVFNSGDDVPSGGRKLAHHFDTEGTPIMIGGGELAFTLLGVDFDEKTGDTRFLIMDPHYTGADDLSLIQPKWVGWKSADSLTHLGTKLFQSETFYMFCLPMRPSDV